MLLVRELVPLSLQIKENCEVTRTQIALMNFFYSLTFFEVDNAYEVLIVLAFQ